MRGICVNSTGPSTKELAELNNHVRNEQKEVRDGVTGEGQGLSEEDESRINEDEDATSGRKLLAQPLAINQRPFQQPQGSVVCWERFLPVRTLKVLLVENDHSTRHVVSALLRNCSYEVTAVANGIEAWKILQDLSNHVDLVLTEVAMPYLSGIGLLSKIMNHKTCKNIPVIMMSSNDSMGIVFKCLSKGAVDFLVKPIRKNELKNLWQHVWRKCHSSSGSGSESGIRTQKSSKSKSIEGSGNNSVSNDEDDMASIGVNNRDGSDNGSGTQSSWTKRAVEVDSPQLISPWDELADAPDSTCAQVIHPRPEAFSKSRPTAATKECHRNAELGDIAMGKDLEIGVLRNSDREMEDQNKKLSLALTGVHERKNLEAELEKDGTKLEKDQVQLDGVMPNEKSTEVADFISVVNCANNGQMDSVVAEIPKDILKTNVKDEDVHGPKGMPSLELSLKRQRDVGDTETIAYEQNVLRRSNLSAFSRYNTISTVNQTPTGNAGSCSPNQRSNGSSNNNDMGSTTDNNFAKQACSDKPMPKPVSVHPCSAFQPVRGSHVASLQPATPGKGEAATANTSLVQASGIQPHVQVQHHHHHYHHHHHHVLTMQQQTTLASDENSPLRTVVGPSYDLTAATTTMEGNAANYSLNGSASGSNNGSNRQDGFSNAVVTERANISGENILTGNSGPGSGGGSGSGSGSGVDQNRNAHRETALNKFRQKRKERCFEKKVRYQSRKKLAEQRPRVRGQFVRQGVCDTKSKDTDS